MTTATATVDPRTAPTRSSSSPLRRFAALATAEWSQLRRNTTLMFTALTFPVAMPIIIYLLARSQDGGNHIFAALSMEMFFAFALLFVQFYTVLSMATTRRDEHVLKRLRTGEARDAEILAAISWPGAVLSAVLFVIVSGLLVLLGAPFAVNIVPVAVAFLLGLAASALLAFMTSAYTRNAEAAQLTSMPVMVLALGSMSSLRALLPENVQAVLDWTPFALMYDLALTGWSGLEPGQEAAPMDFTEVLVHTWQPMLALAAWAVALAYLLPRVMTWDTRR